MSKNYKMSVLNLDDLILDKKNPRFAELYSGSDKESEIIDYLLNTESADELVEAIIKAKDYYDDKPLWVIKSEDDDTKYIVKDGNRRCSAVKALQNPAKYELGVEKFEIKQLPVLIYEKITDLDTRIRIEHNSQLFKKWGRIAKALEIERLFSSGNSIDSLRDIDSKPIDFIKIATFYHESVKLEGEKFKVLVREGRKKGGKTVIFERLFRVKNKCGYSFRNTGQLFIKDKKLFQSYVKAIVAYLGEHSELTSRIIDTKFRNGENFLLELKPYGFPPETTTTPTNTATNNTESSSQEQISSNGSTSNNSEDSNTFQNSSSNNSNSSNSSNSNSSNNSYSSNNSSGDTNSSKSGGPSSNQTNQIQRHTVKKNPSLKRKQIPAALKTLIDECYKLEQLKYPNAKTALVRVSFECTLKYIVENTRKSNGNILKTSNHFNSAYKNSKQKDLPYTNFDVLKAKFAELIIDVGMKKAFDNFDLQNPHQIIHNYHVGAVPADAKALSNNLIPLLDFMLQEESDLVKSLNMSIL